MFGVFWVLCFALSGWDCVSWLHVVSCWWCWMLLCTFYDLYWFVCWLFVCLRLVCCACVYFVFVCSLLVGWVTTCLLDLCVLVCLCFILEVFWLLFICCLVFLLSGFGWWFWWFVLFNSVVCVFVLICCLCGLTNLFAFGGWMVCLVLEFLFENYCWYFVVGNGDYLVLRFGLNDVGFVIMVADFCN